MKKEGVEKSEEGYKHPPIVMDLVLAYKQWYGIHQHMPKLFRITISTQLMEALSECISLCVEINFAKKNNKEKEIGREKLIELRGKIELIKAYSLISWEMKMVSHGFYSQFLERVENISKQAAMWHQWASKHYE